MKKETTSIYFLMVYINLSVFTCEEETSSLYFLPTYVHSYL